MVLCYFSGFSTSSNTKHSDAGDAAASHLGKTNKKDFKIFNQNVKQSKINPIQYKYMI